MFIKNDNDIVSQGNRRGRETVIAILEAGLQAVDPYANTRKLVRVEGGKLLVGGQPDMDVSGFGDEIINLAGVGDIYVVGAGKAVQMQAKALEDILGERLSGGAITVKKGEGCYLRKIAVTEGAHPVPDEQSVAGTERIVEIARAAKAGDLVFTLFSSGASSLFVLPAPSFTLAEVRAVYRLAIKYGHQTIIHRTMPYFSAVNSGRIIQLIHPARTVNLIMALDRYERWQGKLHSGGCWIPSWPPGPRRLRQAAAELRAEPWYEEIPAPMRQVLERGDPADDVPDLDRFREMAFSYWQPVDSHRMLEAAKRKAEAFGVRGAIIGSWYWADCGEAARLLAGIAREVAERGNPFEPPVALISGGELTVPVGTATGVGGRNQEFALATALQLGPRLGKQMVIAAIDSDGTDGPGTQLLGGEAADLTCLAGGIADGYTLPTAKELGIDLAAELKNHNSTPPLIKLKSGIVTGNTGTCAGDLRVIVVPERTAR